MSISDNCVIGQIISCHMMCHSSNGEDGAKGVVSGVSEVKVKEGNEVSEVKVGEVNDKVDKAKM
jgi:hypothetical protein